MNTRCPVPASTVMARANSTGARRLSYQYPAPASGPVSTCPVIAEIIGICPGCGLTPAKASRISWRIGSTRSECDA
jgi:hypothetical protein